MADLLGLLTPFRRDEVSDFATGTGSDLLRSKIGQVLGTMAASVRTPGELPWRSEFGSLLELVRHSNNDAMTAEMARAHVSNALRRWLPSVQAESVTAAADGDTLTLRVAYRVVEGRNAGETGTAEVSLST